MTTIPRLLLATAAPLLGLACAADRATTDVRALDGLRLDPPTLDAARAAALQADTRQAVIWYGRRLAYEYRYREAVDVFTDGLERWPDSHELLRHRGHRWITLRDFDRAVDDLSRAERLSRDLPDAVEPDGAPNPAGVPRSTVRSNILYHLALAHYLRGEFVDAARTWRDGLALSRNDDMTVSHAWWLALSLARCGADAPTDLPTVDEVLAPIHADMDILENDAYRDLLLMARGERSAEELLGGGDDIAGTTTAYGVAAWRLAGGDDEGGLELCARIVDGGSWMAFGAVAAEAELFRRGRLRSGSAPRSPGAPAPSR